MEVIVRRKDANASGVNKWRNGGPGGVRFSTSPQVGLKLYPGPNNHIISIIEERYKRRSLKTDEFISSSGVRWYP